MIVVTGGAGFIGSALIGRLNQAGLDEILVVDELGTSDKWKNLRGKKFDDYFEKDDFLDLIREGSLDSSVTAIFHIGACSSTTERDASYLVQNNYAYSQCLCEWAVKQEIPFHYASSAATYGDGSQGYNDDPEGLAALRPLNMYGFSKHLFDEWILRNNLLSRVVGYKYFNVFGPNEYHKEEMRSVVVKAYEQISATGELKLFKSHRPEYQDGEQMRDFVYIKDVVEVMYRIYEKGDVHGLYNLGTGQARTWNDLAAAVFAAMGRDKRIIYIPIPEEIRDRYQYYTQAEMKRLRAAMGEDLKFSSLEEAVADYVTNYLAGPEYAYL